MENFNDLLNEYQSIGVGSLIYGFILDAVTPLVKNYPPDVYSPNGIWDDDAITGVCNDFIIHKLLEKGWLDAHFIALDSTYGLRKVLKRDFRHYLISHKVRTERTNLFIRMKKILRENSETFQSFSKNGADGNLWGLANWTQKEVIQDVYVVTQAFNSIQIPRIVRYRADSSKISPLISNPDLINLIKEIFMATEKIISLDILFDAMCNRLGVLSDETNYLDEPINNEDELVLGDLISDSVTPETTLSSRQIAENIFEQLSNRQREILSLRFSTEEPNLTDIGNLLGISKSTVGNELHNIELIIKDTKTDKSDIDLVTQFLKEFLITNQNANKSK